MILLCLPWDLGLLAEVFCFWNRGGWMGVFGGVGGEVGRLARETWGSWWGRGLFFLHLVVAVGTVGYAWNNLGDPWTLEVFVPAWRAWVFMVDWPAQPFMR